MRSLAIILALTLPAAADPWPICVRGQPEAACVVDGDGAHYRGVTIRLWRTDAPEVGQPHCRAEYEAGIRARDRLADLLGSGDVAVITDGKLDRYGRLLAGLTVDGADVEDVMMREGVTLSYHVTTKAARVAHWCGR